MAKSLVVNAETIRILTNARDLAFQAKMAGKVSTGGKLYYADRELARAAGTPIPRHTDNVTIAHWYGEGDLLESAG